jgi:hypothetical protein
VIRGFIGEKYLKPQDDAILTVEGIKEKLTLMQ